MAARDLEPGEALLVEAPLLLVRPGEDGFATFLALPPETQLKIFELYQGPSSAHVFEHTTRRRAETEHALQALPPQHSALRKKRRCVRQMMTMQMQTIYPTFPLQRYCGKCFKPGLYFPS